MNFIVRPARENDLDALYEMAKLVGGGMTNLPPERSVLAEKLERSNEALEKAEDVPGDDLYVLALEDLDTGKVRGTAQIFGRIGEELPFYSYRIGTLTQASRELGRSFRAEMLTLTSDYDGCSEVGGLFVHPAERAGGLGMLLARSRYLFIKRHRARFAQRTLAELRGVIDEAGSSPFWDALGGRFFGMSFDEADQFNSRYGNQFIADLMPKHPIYTAMLPDAARNVIGVPHPSGRAAMRMLEAEGFAYEGYIDIFDGGPTMVAQTDQIRTIATAKDAKLIATGLADEEQSLIAAGRLQNFRVTWGVVEDRDGGVALNPKAAAALGATIGDTISHVPH
jgi:arginine N-succinyltransferase